MNRKLCLKVYTLALAILVVIAGGFLQDAAAAVSFQLFEIANTGTGMFNGGQLLL